MIKRKKQEGAKDTPIWKSYIHHKAVCWVPSANPSLPMTTDLSAPMPSLSSQMTPRWSAPSNTAMRPVYREEVDNLSGATPTTRCLTMTWPRSSMWTSGGLLTHIHPFTSRRWWWSMWKTSSSWEHTSPRIKPGWVVASIWSRMFNNTFSTWGLWGRTTCPQTSW